jgi:hypothetical protein
MCRKGDGEHKELVVFNVAQHFINQQRRLEMYSTLTK